MRSGAASPESNDASIHAVAGSSWRSAANVVCAECPHSDPGLFQRHRTSPPTPYAFPGKTKTAYRVIPIQVLPLPPNSLFFIDFFQSGSADPEFRVA